MRAKKYIRSTEFNIDDVLWVIIPCRNEEAYIESCLDSFREQTDKRFRLVVVDNDSSDTTLVKVRAWVQDNSKIVVDLLEEAKPGTVYTCMVGFSYALGHGAAMVARTDADCLADPNWVNQARTTLVDGSDFVAGKLKARSDEWSNPLVLKAMALLIVIRLLVVLARVVGRGPSTTILMAGGNMALTAELYRYVGGFTADMGNEDVELTDHILEVTKNGRQNNAMIIHTSLRRLKNDGLARTLRWYTRKMRRIGGRI